MQRLLVITGSMNAGGAETFLMKIYRNMDRTKYQMDFALGIREKGVYDDEIIRMGGRIYYVPPKTRNLVAFYKGIKEIVRDNHYNSVMRMSQFTISALDLFAAKQGGAQHLIMRSTNSQVVEGKKQQIINILFSWMPKVIPTTRFAPSTEAAEFLFGKGCITNGKAIIIHNAVPVEKFVFCEEKRKAKRKELGVSDENFVVCHMGRFEHQKNHEFLIDVFYEIKKKKDSAILVLVGDGSLFESIKKKVEILGLSDSVQFLGIRKDIPEILMASDIDIFPSFYEGMPNTIIEAQAAGLKCIVSDTITKEVAITDRVHFMSLNSSAKEWADMACSVEINHTDTYEEFKAQKYDIDSVVNQFVDTVFDV